MRQAVIELGEIAIEPIQHALHGLVAEKLYERVLDDESEVEDFCLERNDDCIPPGRGIFVQIHHERAHVFGFTRRELVVVVS